jgi:hypothetical protein
MDEPGTKRATLRRVPASETPFGSIALKIGNPQLENVLRELSRQVEIEMHNAKGSFVSRTADVNDQHGRVRNAARTTPV